MSEALGRRGDGEGQEQRVEEEGAGGHTMGGGRYHRCRPAGGRQGAWMLERVSSGAVGWRVVL